MRKLKFTIAAIVASLIFASCSTVYPLAVSSNTIGSKEGTSSTVILGGAAGFGNPGFGLVLNGKYGVIEAAEKGGLKSVATADVKVTNYVIFQKAEIIVTGE